MTAPMTPTTLAETILRDVPRYGCEDQPLLPETEVLAALTAALDPAIAERVGRIVEDWEGQASERDPRDPTREQIYREAADIRALLTANAALRAERDVLKGCIEQLQGPLTVAALTARAEAAEAQIAALTARVEGLTGALAAIVDHDLFYDEEWLSGELVAKLKAARAALSATTEESK